MKIMIEGDNFSEEYTGKSSNGLTFIKEIVLDNYKTGIYVVTVRHGKNKKIMNMSIL